MLMRPGTAATFAPTPTSPPSSWSAAVTTLPTHRHTSRTSASLLMPLINDKFILLYYTNDKTNKIEHYISNSDFFVKTNFSFQNLNIHIK